MTDLAQVKIGDRAQVAQVSGSDDLAVRLMEMGLTPGVDVEVIGVAPLGDPIEIAVRGYRLSLRRSEASRVEIQSS